MAKSEAFWAFGSQVKLGDGATPELFTAIAEVKDISISPSRDNAEVTHQASPLAWKEFIPTLRDGGSLDLDINWLPTNATHDGTTGWWETFNDDELHNWQLVLPAAIGATISFAGFLESPDLELPVEEHGQGSLSIKISGPITIS